MAMKARKGGGGDFWLNSWLNSEGRIFQALLVKIFGF